MKLHKNLIIVMLVLLIAATSCIAVAEENAALWLRLDAENADYVLPREFRMIEELAISGSGQFAENNLQAIKSQLSSKNVIIVDLREESHGFINGIPVSWYGQQNWANKGKMPDIILADEKNRLAELQAVGQAVVNKKVKKLEKDSSPEVISKQQAVLQVESALTEEQMAQKYGFGYYRITNTDHIRPLDRSVDQFIGFVNALPSDTWLHFHCEAGHGRTTTFMAMIDMMRHAKSTSIDDIIQRQYQAGGINLFSQDETGDKAIYSAERIAFLRQFYTYCQQNNDGFVTPWSTWLAANQ